MSEEQNEISTAEAIVSRIERKEILDRNNKKIGEKEVFYSNKGTILKEISYVDMNDNRRFDILDSVTTYKDGYKENTTIFKREQVIRFNKDGSVRNVTKY